ncbi:F-box/LRR-repeat protein At3g26922-like isoform X1 [Miscanthus floridulus]|uniref:F-box/LRR-repeat protein At3g26922-like isoform X1 n=2 Tax=Miscanthus floridulus TaxID=154761 RepID=UPI0034586A0C
MAPLARRRKNALAAAPPAPVIDPADRISKLPEEIQAQILSFLPAQEAVRTCVLARTWRHVWKFTRRLLITGDSVQEVREFVDRLLINFASLDVSEIRFDPCEEFDNGDDIYPYLDDEDTSSLNRWISRVLECQIQMLWVDIGAQGYFDAYLQMSNRLVSRHLTRLELTGVLFICRCLNLDGCPALEHLEINECCLEDVRKITSLSLKHLVITSCESNGACNRIQICVPRLVSLLCLGNIDVMTPLLERMPELVEAKFQINSYRDKCYCDDPMACYHITRDGDTSDIDSDSDDGEEGSGDYAGQNTTKCVVLEGLAQARDLVLIADHPTFIFKRDLRWCPTFSMLKTLVLTQVYRCEPADCSVLECMLEHAPLLEKLTLTLKKELQDGKYKVEIKGYPDAKVKSTKISQHLQIVKIICEDVNGIFVNVLNFLGTLNLCFETRVTKK